MQKIEVGVELFLLGIEKQGEAETTKEHSLATITAVEADHFIVTTRGKGYSWSSKEIEIELRFELPLKDPARFLFLVDQEIDGLSFTPYVPVTPGQYWFYGLKCRHDEKLRFGLGKVSVGNNIGYWFFHDFAFAGSMSMKGLWAKAVVPKMPGHDGEVG